MHFGIWAVKLVALSAVFIDKKISAGADGDRVLQTVALVCSSYARSGIYRNICFAANGKAASKQRKTAVTILGKGNIRPLPRVLLKGISKVLGNIFKLRILYLIRVCRNIYDTEEQCRSKKNKLGYAVDNRNCIVKFIICRLTAEYVVYDLVLLGSRKTPEACSPFHTVTASFRSVFYVVQIKSVRRRRDPRTRTVTRSCYFGDILRGEFSLPYRSHGADDYPYHIVKESVG